MGHSTRISALRILTSLNSVPLLTWFVHPLSPGQVEVIGKLVTTTHRKMAEGLRLGRPCAVFLGVLSIQLLRALS